jgi:hypothetical protein
VQKFVGTKLPRYATVMIGFVAAGHVAVVLIVTHAAVGPFVKVYRS